MNRRGFIHKAGMAAILAYATPPSLLGAGLRGFTPRSLPSPQMFWDAGRVDGSSVPYDLSGAGRTATNANVTIQTNIDKGRPVMRFNGTNAGYTLGTSITTGASFSCFVRGKYTNSTTAAAGIQWISGPALYQVLCGAAGPVLSCYSGGAYSSNTLDHYSAFSTFGVVCNAGSLTYYQAGSSIGTAATFPTGNTVSGYGRATSFFSTMDVNKCGFWNAAFTTQQVSLLTYFFDYKAA